MSVQRSARPSSATEETGGRGGPSAENSGSTVGRDELAVRLSRLARDLQHESSSEDVLTQIVRAAVGSIPGVEHGSISVVVARKDVDSHAPSGDLPRWVDALQTETGQGPCLDAVYEQATVRVDDMRTETRWPEFSRRASEAGAASMLSFQLYVEGDNLGALNLYSGRPHAFDDESEHVGLLFAAHAAVALAGVQKVEQMAAGMASRDLIGQAKGIVMERHHVDSHRAFLLLARLSQDSNLKLKDVAAQVVGDCEGRDQ